jgi:hypothetical protein
MEQRKLNEPTEEKWWHDLPLKIVSILNYLLALALAVALILGMLGKLPIKT